jgi:hypothetical protein
MRTKPCTNSISSGRGKPSLRSASGKAIAGDCGHGPLLEALRLLLRLVDDGDDLNRLIDHAIGHREGSARYHEFSAIDDLAGMSLQRIDRQARHRGSDVRGDLTRDPWTIGGDVARLLSKLQASRR